MPNASPVSTLLGHRFAVLALGYGLADVVSDLVIGHHHNVTSLLIVVPILVAFERNRRWTAVSSVFPIVVVATNLLGYDRPSPDLPVRLSAMVLAALFGLYASGELQRGEVTLTHSRAAAEAAQRAILPVVPDRLGPLTFSSLYRSSAEESLVGGDFYKVIRSPWGTRLIVGDVEGKGLAAVSMSALVLGCFREWAPRLSRLEDLVQILNERVGGYEERSAFVTAIVATVSDDLEVELANCGHLPPLLARDGSHSTLTPTRPTTPLGLGSTPTIQRVHLRQGDRLFLFTDGLTETRTAAGEWIPLDDVVTGLATDPFLRTLDNVATRLTTRGLLADDLAMLLVEVSRPETGSEPSTDVAEGARMIPADGHAAGPVPLSEHTY